MGNHTKTKTFITIRTCVRCEGQSWGPGETHGAEGRTQGRKRKEGRELSGGGGEERCKGRALEEVETTFKPSVAQRAGGIIYITPTSD